MPNEELRGRLRRSAPAVLRVALLVFGFMPLWVMAFRELPGLGVIARLGEAWFDVHCHRDPARSLVLGGAVLPVCTRCLGIYLGVGLGALALRPRLGVWALRIWVILAALLMLGDVLSELYGLRPAWAPLRMASGLLLAYPVGSALVWAARQSSGD